MMKGLCPGSISLPTQFSPSFLFSPSVQGHTYMHERKSKAFQTSAALGQPLSGDTTGTKIQLGSNFPIPQKDNCMRR